MLTWTFIAIISPLIMVPGQERFSVIRGNYSNDGTYWRVGVDVNLLVKDPDRNMLFFGARYGKANFSQDLTVLAWNEFTNSLENLEYHNGSVNAHWIELTGGLRVKIWKAIWMGYTARFKFGLSTDDTENIIPSDVPGYGRTNKDSYWGFNYQIFVRIPVRKAPPVMYKVKKKKEEGVTAVMFGATLIARNSPTILALILFEKRVHKFNLVKNLQVVDLLTHTDVSHRYFEFI